MVTFFSESCPLLSKIEVRGPKIGFHNRKIEFLLQIFAFPLARRIKRQSAQINTNQLKSTQIGSNQLKSTQIGSNSTSPPGLDHVRPKCDQAQPQPTAAGRLRRSSPKATAHCHFFAVHQPRADRIYEDNPSLSHPGICI